MPDKTPTQAALIFEKESPDEIWIVPPPELDLSDLDRTHRLIADDHLVDILVGIARKVN